MFKARGGHIDVERFLAGERRMFDLLVISVGKGEVLDRLVRGFFSLGFFVRDQTWPIIKLF